MPREVQIRQQQVADRLEWPEKGSNPAGKHIVLPNYRSFVYQELQAEGAESISENDTVAAISSDEEVQPVAASSSSTQQRPAVDLVPRAKSRPSQTPQGPIVISRSNPLSGAENLD